MLKGSPQSCGTCDVKSVEHRREGPRGGEALSMGSDDAYGLTTNRMPTKYGETYPTPDWQP